MCVRGKLVLGGRAGGGRADPADAAACRFNYDKQYESYMALVKTSGFVPEDEATRKKLNIKKPIECKLPVFEDTPLCQNFDRVGQGYE